jgi:hypothetical protein
MCFLRLGVPETSLHREYLGFDGIVELLGFGFRIFNVICFEIELKFWQRKELMPRSGKIRKNLNITYSERRKQ